MPRSPTRRKTLNNYARRVKFEDFADDSSSETIPLLKNPPKLYQAPVALQKPTIAIAALNQDSKKIKEPNAKNKLQKVWAKTKGYRGSTAVGTAGAAGLIVGGVLLPPAAIISGLVLGSTLLSMSFRVGAENIGNAELDNIIKWNKRLTVALTTATAGCLVGSFFTAGALAIPTVAFGILTSLSASVLNQAVGRKNALFRENNIGAYLEVDNLIEQTQSISPNLSPDLSQGQALSRSPQEKKSLEYQNSRKKGVAKFIAKASDKFGLAFSTLTASFYTTKTNTAEFIGSNLSAASNVVEPISSFVVVGLSMVYEREMEKSGKRNMGKAEERLRLKYQEYSAARIDPEVGISRYEIAQLIVGAAFNKRDLNSEVDNWINFYLLRAVFESNLTDRELFGEQKDFAMAIASLQLAMRGLNDALYRDHKEAMEQIDDWPGNKYVKRGETAESKGKYTKKSKLSVLESLPILKTMVANDLVDSLRESQSPGYKAEIDEIMYILGNQGQNWQDWDIDFIIDLDTNDNKKAFKSYIRQAVITCYDQSLIFGKEEAKSTTIKIIGEHIKKYLQYEKLDKSLKTREKREAVPSRSRLIALTSQNLQGLSKQDERRLKKVSVYNPFYLLQISRDLSVGSSEDLEKVLEVCVHITNTKQIDGDIPKSYLYGGFDQYKLAAKCPKVRGAVEKSLETQKDKVIPQEPYKGVGLRLEVAKKRGDFCLKIADVFSPKIQRFELVGGGGFIDNKTLRKKYITHIVVDGEKKAIDQFLNQDGEVDLVEIKKHFSESKDIGFVCLGGEEYICKNENKKIFVTQNCQNLKTKLEPGQYGAVYQPIQHGVKVFSDFRENVRRTSMPQNQVGRQDQQSEEKTQNTDLPPPTLRPRQFRPLPECSERRFGSRN